MHIAVIKIVMSADFTNNNCKGSFGSLLFYAFRQVEHEVRNKQPPAVRVGNKGYTIFWSIV